MLRLFLDYQNGAGLIPCPRCGRPLLLGAAKMGRWLVAYSPFVRIRRRARKVMLVCPTYECDHTEPVEIVGQKADAVLFNPVSAAHAYLLHERYYRRTLDELVGVLSGLKALYRQTQHQKLPSAIRLWRENFRSTYRLVLSTLKEAQAKNVPLLLERRDSLVRGRVKEVLQHTVIVERADTGERELIRLWDLSRAMRCGENLAPPNQRFNFGGDVRPPAEALTAHRPERFVVIGGHALALEGADRYRLAVSTPDPAASRDLRLIAQHDKFVGELPAVLVERCFRVVTYVHVEGFRLHVAEFTSSPDWVRVRTREMEAASRLRLRRTVQWDGERTQLSWDGYLHRDQVERWEEVQVPMRVPRARRK